MKYKLQKNILLIFLLLTLVFSKSYSQEYKNIEEYKREFLQHPEKLDYLEGIWQFKIVLEKAYSDGTNRSYELAPFQVEIRKGKFSGYFLTHDLLIGLYISEKETIHNYTFQSTSISGRYLFSCSEGNGEAIINNNGDLVFAYSDNINKSKSFYTGIKIFPSMEYFNNHNSLEKK